MGVIDVEQLGDVAVLHWRDDENRFRADSVADLRAALSSVAATDGPLAIVLTGEGKHFSGGLDLDWMAEHPAEAPEMLGELQRLYADVLRIPALTLAAINGHAFAAGAMFTMAFDVRTMRAERGWWCLPEADLGLPFTEGMASLLTGVLPAPTARVAMLSARRYTAAEALAAGIVDNVHSTDELLERTVAQATALATKVRSTTTVTKRQLYGPIVEALMRSADEMASTPS